MQRYLLRFAYDGTPFIGSQIQTKRIPPPEWTESYVASNRKTVQGAIEVALLHLQPANEPRIQLSSRTDTGVHALSTTAVVDLELIRRVKNNYLYFPPKYITGRLNSYFASAKIDIR